MQEVSRWFKASPAIWGCATLIVCVMSAYSCWYILGIGLKSRNRDVYALAMDGAQLQILCYPKNSTAFLRGDLRSPDAGLFYEHEQRADPRVKWWFTMTFGYGAKGVGVPLWLIIAALGAFLVRAVSRSRRESVSER